ncbi:MAG TPA: GYF domain-containing protein, partial [Opitutaceae bacterium]|nr:GYF domain-containing protein [Opitutaceae bacterium]
MFYLAINRVQSGPFAENEVRQRAARGEFGPGDLCWCEGWPQWRRIAEVFPPAAEPPPLPSAAATPPAMPPATRPSGPGAGGAPTSGMAVASLVCGLGVFVLFPFFFLLAPAAVILGHLAKGKIKGAGGRLAGAGLATAGLLCGYVGGGALLALVSTIAFFATREVRRNSQEAAVRTHLEQFWTAADLQLRGNEAPEVTYPELVGEGKPLAEADFAPVAGEDYHSLVVRRGDEWLSITLSDGRTVNFYASSPAAAPNTPEIETDNSSEEGDTSGDSAEPEAEETTPADNDAATP